jgi:hypothetical protein
MSRKFNPMKAVTVSLVLTFLFGCTTNPTHQADIESDQYSTEIKRLENVVRKKGKSSERWQSHYQLAHLYKSHKNPKRNYKKSLENLQSYLKKYPPSKNDHDQQNLLLALTEIQNQQQIVKSQKRKIKKLSSDLAKSKQTNLALREVGSEMEKFNSKLSMKIENLKTLDQNVEEKRKSFNNQ